MRRQFLRYILPENRWGDAVYARIDYRLRLGRFPRTKNPQTYNEHLAKMRVEGSLLDPLRQFVSDKEYVKTYISGVVGEKYAVKTYQILKTADDVDRFVPDRLPCVVKPTQSSGRFIILTESDPLPDRKLMKEWLKENYYKFFRESNYHYLVPKIIVEEFLSEDGRTPPPDYRIFCFHGVPKLIQIDLDRLTGQTRNSYDVLWNRLPVAMKWPTSAENARPPELEEMLDVAARLARPFSFIRVDMYVMGGEIRVGELTNCPANAATKISPPSAALALGKLFEPGDPPDLLTLLAEAEKQA